MTESLSHRRIIGSDYFFLFFTPMQIDPLGLYAPAGPIKVSSVRELQPATYGLGARVAWRAMRCGACVVCHQPRAM